MLAAVSEQDTTIAGADSERGELEQLGQQHTLPIAAVDYGRAQAGIARGPPHRPEASGAVSLADDDPRLEPRPARSLFTRQPCVGGDEDAFGHRPSPFIGGASSRSYTARSRRSSTAQFRCSSASRRACARRAARRSGSSSRVFSALAIEDDDDGSKSSPTGGVPMVTTLRISGRSLAITGRPPMRYSWSLLVS